jgi:DNA-binding beta-propeller fold protein YncE
MKKYRTRLFVLWSAALLASCASVENVKSVFEPPVYPPPPDEPRFHYERTILSSADVLIDEDEAAFRRLVTGEARTGTGMGKPYDVAVHQGRIFVSDTEKRSVLVFDARENVFFEIGTKRPGELRKPLGIDVDDSGNLYVCDASAKRIQIFNRDGAHVKSIGNADYFVRPSSVAVNADKSRVYVVDSGGVDSDQHHVLVFDAATGEHLFNIGSRGRGDGELNLPREVSVSSDGLVHVVDSGNFRVQVFTPEGDFVRTIGSVGRQGGQFSRPKGIAIDGDANIYVSDTAFGNFQIFNSEGQLLLHIGERGAAGEPGTFMLPNGVEVDEDGRVYVVDQFSKKIDIFRPHRVAPGQGYLASMNGDMATEVSQ